MRKIEMQKVSETIECSPKLFFMFILRLSFDGQNHTFLVTH
jgi:hypothetical protein